MRLEPPVKVTREQLIIDVAELEPLLQGPALEMKPWPPATIQIRDGRTMLVREPRMDEIKTLMEYVKKVMDVEHDFYDVVGARVYAELLGLYRKRIKDPYLMIGMIDGQLAGLVNGRLMNEDINISHHTMTFMRGGRVGAALFYCKAYYAFEILGQKEFWSTYESYNGWRIGGLGMAQPSYPWPDVQHELGGAKVYYVTRKYWDSTIKKYARQMVGSDLNFDVPDEVLEINKTVPMPGEVTV
ncbi:MAG TPA: N-acetyltransferase [Anaerolineae bacterium]|nr:N-acetyltransferase [Anaerolineae bacterium]